MQQWSSSTTYTYLNKMANILQRAFSYVFWKCLNVDLNFTDVSAHGSKLGQNIRWTWNSLESYTLWCDRRPARYSCMNWLEISIDMVFKSLKMLLLTLLRQRNTLKSICMKNYTQTLYFRQIIVYHGTIYVPQTGDYTYVIQIPFSIA